MKALDLNKNKKMMEKWIDGDNINLEGLSIDNIDELQQVVLKQGIPFDYLEEESPLKEFIEFRYDGYITKIYQGAIWIYEDEDIEETKLIKIIKIPNQYQKEYKKIVKSYYVNPNDILSKVIGRTNQLLKEGMELSKVLDIVREEFRIAPFYKLSWIKQFVVKNKKKGKKRGRKPKNKINDENTKIIMNEEKYDIDAIIFGKEEIETIEYSNNDSDLGKLELRNKYKDLIEETLQFNSLAEVSRYLLSLENKLPENVYKIIYDVWVLEHNKFKELKVKKNKIKVEPLF